MNKLALIILILLINPAIFAQETHLYVAVDGSDKNPGTEAKPFASIARARDAARKIKGQAVTVLLREGT